jgi:hypothetical protein
LARLLSDYPARSRLPKWQDRKEVFLQSHREIPVARDYPTVENTSWADKKTMPAKRSLPSWLVCAFAVLGLLGLCFGVSGIMMTGSFAVAGPAAAAATTLDYWKRIQLWYDALAVGSLVLLGTCAVSLARRVVRADRHRDT